MKSALIATIALTAVVCLALRCESKQLATDITETAQDQNAPTVAPPDSTQQTATSDQASKNGPPVGDSPAQWILVFVTTVTAAFICWQAWETRKAATAAADSVEAFNKQAGIMERQTKATETAADAALLNAKAVINAERPWLVVTWLSDKDVLGLFRISCRNQGKTPAKVLSISATWSIVNNLNDLTPPDYSSPEVSPDLTLIVSDKSFQIGHGINPESILLRNAEQRPLVNDGRAFLIYYGKLIYRDTFYDEDSGEGIHETYWCFIYVPCDEGRFDKAPIPSRIGSLRRGGPKEYNRYT